MASMGETTGRTVEPAAEAPLQFGIRDLLIAQAVCAVCLGLFVTAGILALLAIFVATLVYCAIPAPPGKIKLKRCIVDLLGGIALPAMCLVYDPLVFREGSADRLRALAFVAIVLQMLTLPIWMVGGRRLGRCGALVGGALCVGAAVAGILGVVLVPISFIGLIVFGIGLLGFTPFLTCVVFARNALDAVRYAPAARGKEEVLLFALFATGFVLAATAPIVLELSFGEWIDSAIRSLPAPPNRWLEKFFGVGC
jgi:hypothetical protein